MELTELVYPAKCPLCGEVLDSTEKYTCSECSPLINFVGDVTCLRCGKNIDSEDEELCGDCQNKTRTFIRGFPAVVYAEPFPKSVGEFKYKNKRNYVGFFGWLIVKRHGRAIINIAPDVLVPVPVHPKKKRSRGYNQAELLAAELGRLLKIPVDSELLCREKYTTPQRELNDTEREKNLKRAFNSKRKIVEYKSAMLVDDIYTTGSTIEACTQILHELGINEVYYTSICIGKGN